MIEKFAELVQKRHEYAKQWEAKTGGKAFGYLCCYMTEEILYAALPRGQLRTRAEAFLEMLQLELV